MKKRIISAGIMIAILVPLMIIGGLPFKIAVGLISILAYKEFIDLKGFKNYPFGVLICGLIALLSLVYSNNDELFGIIGLNYKYLMFTILILFIPVVFYFNSKKYEYKDALELAGFVIFFGIILNLLTNILIYEKVYFFMLLLVTILTDTFAYFTGISIGKHKVTKISPKKSIEGYIGGTVMATILTAIYYVAFIGAAPLIKVVPVLVLLSIAAHIGDLFFSAIKRQKDIKDFSNLIPGHGGVLDRIDSLSFVVMTFVLLYGII